MVLRLRTVWSVGILPSKVVELSAVRCSHRGE